MEPFALTSRPTKVPGTVGTGSRTCPSSYLVPLILTMLAFSLSACATSLTERSQRAEELALPAGFEKTLLPAGDFVLTAFSRLRQKEAPLRVYIEGDGYAWVTPSRSSGNPTPREPMLLELAAEDPAPNVVYLARPCQYTPEELNLKCESFYWTNGRFSEEVVKSMDQAVTFFKQKTGSPQVELVGYSGGGAVCALLAERRNDIQSLRTIAGNLDPEQVNQLHGASSLSGSLDPIEKADELRSLPMRHFVGEEDSVIPPSIAQAFAKRAGDLSEQTITQVKGATHSKGWIENWKELLTLEPLTPVSEPAKRPPPKGKLFRKWVDDIQPLKQ